MLKSALFVAAFGALALRPDVVLAQGAPGVEARCHAALQRCLDGAPGNAGAASRCRATYEACSRRGDTSGTAYRNCMAKAKTAAQKDKCRSNYQRDR